MEHEEAGHRGSWPSWVMGRLGERVGGNWRIVGVLGLGGVGVVYEVIGDDGVSAALKFLRTDIALGPDAARRFAREAELAASVGGEGILRVLDRSASSVAEPWFVMERAYGADLESLLQGLGHPMGARQAARVTASLLSTLAACHHAGILHRDVKPANLFVSPDLAVHLTDFGGAVRVGERDESRVGSPEYMAPEQAVHASDALDARCDIFAAGAVLFRLVAGSPIRSADSASDALVIAATTPPPSLASAAPSAPSELVRIVDTALAFNPADRFATAAEMREALLAFLDSGVEFEQHEDGEPDDNLAVQALRDAFAVARTLRSGSGADSAAIQEQRRLLREALRHLSPLVGCLRRRTGDPKETQRRVDRLAESLAAAADQLGGSSLLAVRPNGLAFAGSLVWEPDELLADVPHELFSLGVRSFCFHSGFTRIELVTWAQLVAAAAQRDGSLESVLEPFVRGQMAHIRATLVAAFDVSLLDRLADIDVAFGVARREIDAAMGHALAAEHVPWTDAARALLRQTALTGIQAKPSASGSYPVAATELIDGDRLRQTYRRDAVDALRAALLDARALGDVERVLPAVTRSFTDAILRADLQGALARLELLLAVEPSGTRDELLGRTLDENAIRSLLGAADSLVTASGEPLVNASTLQEILEIVAADRWPLLWDVWISGADSPGSAHIGNFLLHRAERSFPVLGEQLAATPAVYIPAVLDAIAKARDAVAFAALRQLGRHPGEDVRLAAIGQRIARGDSVEPTELQRLIASPQPAIRLRALAITRESGRTGFAAMLATYALADGFHALPLAERQQVLSTLHALSPAQAEAVCIELLPPRQWVDEAGTAATRQLAAGLLGSLGHSPAARDALRTESRRVLRSTGEMRAVAREALDVFEARRQDGSR